MVFVDCNKNINKPYNVFDVVSGDEIAVNLDLMGANVTTENVEEAVAAKLVPKITRDPKEAIIVLFDISSSMGGGFFN